MRAERLAGYALLLLAVSPPAAAQAPGRVADSVSRRVDTAATRMVQLRAANVSFQVSARPGAGLTALLRPAPGAAPRGSEVGLLRAAAAGDTLRVDLTHALTAAYQLAVTLPPGLPLLIQGDNGGPVVVEGTGAPVEVSHSNGGVTIRDAAGYALVSTSNGNLSVGLRSLQPGVPMSFITSNGFIDLTLPADARVTLVVDPSIVIESEFPLVRDRASVPYRAHINGGGPTIRLYTDNGSVRIHRLTPAPRSPSPEDH